MRWHFPRSRTAQEFWRWAAVACLLLCQAASVAGAVYYVDSAGGKDSNRGTSRRTAWRTLAKVNATVFHPGDRILFKAGCSWTGQFEPQGNGKAAAPIRVDRYDTGAKPSLNGGGARSAITLNSQQYWEIQNLEVSNTSAKRGAGRSGIRLIAGQEQACAHLYVRNCTVHEIHGAERSGIAGIVASCSQGWFADLRIENCVVREIDGDGLLLQGNHQNRKSTILARNNLVSLCGGSGIRMTQCGAGSVDSYNVVYETCSAPGEEGEWCGANAVARSEGAVVEYNESHHNGGPSGKGGQGFSLGPDSIGSVVQYNYSHDNVGFIVVVGTEPTGVVRYNISQGDRRRALQAAGRISPIFQVYNNVVYLERASEAAVVEGDFGATFRNNIIMNLGLGGYACASGTWEGNCYFGNHPASEPADGHRLTCDPEFFDAGGAGDGRNTCSAYQLTSGSPCIDAGTRVAENGGRDFFGTPLYQGEPDLGIHEFVGHRHLRAGGAGTRHPATESR